MNFGENVIFLFEACVDQEAVQYIVYSEVLERHTDTLDSTILCATQSVRAPFSSASAMIFSVETSVSAIHPAVRH